MHAVARRALPVLALIAGLALGDGATAAPAEEACDLAQITSVRELHDTLSRRAVEVVERAAGRDWKTDPRLAALVAANAKFNLGAGDVGRPLGVGVKGVRTLAEAMKADGYRFRGWDYMDGPTTPCGPQKVTVEFTASSARRSAELEFQFNAGRVTAATGWERSMESGSISPVGASR